VDGTDTLVAFLEKPTVIATGTFQTSDTAGSTLSSWSFPSTLVSKPRNLNKLKGVLAYRADIEFEFKWNGTRFQKGLYMLRIVYLGGAGSCSAATKIANAHVGNLTLATSGPHYTMDIATETSLRFTVPYTSVSNFALVDYTSVYNRDWFKLYLIPYDPLAAGSGDTTCQYTMWARFTNITTTGNVVLQSAGSIELKKAGLGPISGAAAKISKTATVLGEIPILAPFTKTVSWIADVVGRSAKIWGFSKPMVMAPPNPMTRQGVAFSAQGDGVFHGHRLALSSSNEVPVTTGRSRVGVDEMSFDFIKSQPAFIYSANWDDTQTSGTLITSFAVGPGSTTYPLYKGAAWPPCDYLSLPFSFWRGSSKFKIIIPKTEFHSGRLMIAILPTEAGAVITPPATLSDTDNLTRIIWDIRESNELEFEVPFIQTRNFIPCGSACATVYIFVVNELIAPSTVPSSVNLLVEKSGGHDLTYSSPVSKSTSGYYYEPYVYYQSGVLDLGVTKTPPVIEAESAGEVVKSLRTLLKRFSIFNTVGSATVQTFQIDIFSNPVVNQLTSTSGALERLNARSDLISLFSLCYAFSSGTMRLAFGSNNSLPRLYDVSIQNSSQTGVDAVASYSTRDSSCGNMHAIAVMPIEGVALVEVPCYQPFGARAVMNRIPGSTTVYPTPATADIGGTNQLVNVNCSQTIDYTTSGITVYRAAGEDFNLSVWNGVMPVVLSYVS